MTAPASRDAIDATQWAAFLEQVTKERQGDAVTIEVLTQDYGDQLEAEKLPFAYIEYDGHDDVVIVAVGGRDGRYPVVLRHVVHRPRAVLADPPDPAQVEAVEVIGDDDQRTIVTWHDRPALPPPAGS